MSGDVAGVLTALLELVQSPHIDKCKIYTTLKSLSSLFTDDLVHEKLEKTDLDNLIRILKAFQKISGLSSPIDTPAHAHSLGCHILNSDPILDTTIMFACSQSVYLSAITLCYDPDIIFPLKRDELLRIYCVAYGYDAERLTKHKKHIDALKVIIDSMQNDAVEKRLIPTMPCDEIVKSINQYFVVLNLEWCTKFCPAVSSRMEQIPEYGYNTQFRVWSSKIERYCLRRLRELE